MPSKASCHLYMVGDACWSSWHEEAPAIIFILPSLFSLLHLKKYVGLAKLQSDLQSFNCIEFDLLFFNFVYWHLFFMVLKGRSVMTKDLKAAQQVSSSSQGVHLL
jgi:hypothetical protein